MNYIEKTSEEANDYTGVPLRRRGDLYQHYYTYFGTRHITPQKKGKGEYS